MLSPLVTERITTPKDVFYCDCKPDCVDRFKLPTLAVDMLMTNTALVLIVGKHKPPTGDYKLVTKGKGWRIYKALPIPLGDKAVA